MIKEISNSYPKSDMFSLNKIMEVWILNKDCIEANIINHIIKNVYDFKFPGNLRTALKILEIFPQSSNICFPSSSQIWCLTFWDVFLTVSIQCILFCI